MSEFSDARSAAFAGAGDPIGPHVKQSDHWAAVWIAVAFWAITLIGWVGLCKLFPVPSPLLSPEEVAALFRENPTAMRAGLVCVLVGLGTFTPLFVLLFLHMKRVEGPWAFWSYTQLILSALGGVSAAVGFFAFLVAAYRPEFEVDTLYMLWTLGWLTFTMGPSGFIWLQLICLAVVIFRDTEQRVFPRWLGYMCIWEILVYIPSFLIMFFKAGPFAYNGVLGFYFPFSSFAVFLACALTAVMRRNRAAA